jgi:hypothetical protein
VPVLCPAPPCLWKSFRAHRENDSGAARKPFAFPSESLFTFSPESCSPSPRNAFHVHPGIAFTFRRNPHRYRESELLQLSVNPGRSPPRILRGHPMNQIPDFRCGLRSAAAWPRTPTPVEAKARSMPSDHRLGFHDDQCVTPTGPNPAKRTPEDPVERVQVRPRPLPLQNGELLPESEDLQSVIGAVAEQCAESSEEGEDEVEHRLDPVTP